MYIYLYICLFIFHISTIHPSAEQGLSLAVGTARQQGSIRCAHKRSMINQRCVADATFKLVHAERLMNALHAHDGPQTP